MSYWSNGALLSLAGLIAMDIYADSSRSDSCDQTASVCLAEIMLQKRCLDHTGSYYCTKCIYPRIDRHSI